MYAPVPMAAAMLARISLLNLSFEISDTLMGKLELELSFTQLV